MGFIAKILEFNDRKVKIDSGGGNITTAEHYPPVGDDSQPLITDDDNSKETDYALAVETMGTGKSAIVGYIDLKNEPKSEAGEKRIYARDKDTGEEVAEIWLKNTGEIIIKNSAGEIKLLPNGDANINGTVLKPGGIVTCNSITIGGLSFSSHVHGGVSTGTSNTGTPV